MMRIYTAPLLVSLVIINLQITEIRTETAFDLAVNILKSTLPCLAPCLFENYESFADAVYYQCLIPLYVKMSVAGPLPTPPTTSDSLLGEFHTLQQYCPYYDEILTCSVRVTSRYCGSSLSDKLLIQGQKLKYMGCNDTGSTASVFKCLASRRVHEVDSLCSIKLSSGPNFAAVFRALNQNYTEIYREILVPPPGRLTEPPEICRLLTAYRKCFMDDLDILAPPECSPDVISHLGREFNSALDLINCRTYKRENDLLTCLAKPEIVTCIQKDNMTYLQNSYVEHGVRQVLGSFKLDKFCDLVPFMDGCIEKKIDSEPACQPDGFVRKTFRAVTTPMRDYLINEHCDGLTETPSNDEGAGNCKNSYPDYTYGKIDQETTTALPPTKPTKPDSKKDTNNKEDPNSNKVIKDKDPKSASGKLSSFTQLLATLLSVVVMGMLHS